MRQSLILMFVACVGLLAGTRLDAVLSRGSPDKAVVHGANAANSATNAAADPLGKWERLEYRDDSPPVACPEEAPIVAVLGQSNAANSVGHRFVALRDVYELHDGKCYKAAGALAGADLDYGSYWPVVGDILIERGVSRSIVCVGLAKGNTTAAQWADPNDLGRYLVRKLGAIRGVTHVLWHQGEADTATPPEQYAASLRMVIGAVKAAAPNAKILVAQVSLCSAGRESAGLLKSQAGVVDQSKSIFAGPNT